MGRRVWTVLEILKETALFFERKGIPNPRLDAEVLLAHSLNVSRVNLYINFDRPLTDKEISTYRGFVLRRAKREPLSYIIGEKEFWSLNFKVGTGVLIPRQDTETLVEKAIEVLSIDRDRSLNLLDIGTGCGAIAVTLAKEFNKSHGWATDSSPRAIKFAKENAEALGVFERITFLQGRFFEPLREKSNFFDAILSNPPYIKTGDIPSLQQEIRDYEPIEALDGGEDGLDAIRIIACNAFQYLKKRGWLFLEVGVDQALVVSDILKDTGQYTSIQTVKDLSSIERVVIARAS